MKKHVHTTYSDEFDEIPFEVTFEPVGDPLIKRVGDRLVVAYLAQDEDPSNPMKEWDAQGTLYTKPKWRGGGSITDDPQWAGYLGLTEDGEPDLELEVVAEGCFQGFKASLPEEKVTEIAMKYGELPEAVVETVYAYWSPDAYASFRLGEEDGEWAQGYADGLPSYEVAAEVVWQELRAAGKIGAYLAVPVDYCSNNHGPGTTSIGTTSIDAANAVWVPDENCIDNMDFTGCETYWDKLKVAEEYAKSVLDEYEKWCNNDCYGCVVQTYHLENDVWVEEGDFDACWGFIGSEYAEETLKDEYFEVAVKAAEKLNAEEVAQEAEDIRTQRGLQIELEI